LNHKQNKCFEREEKVKLVRKIENGGGVVRSWPVWVLRFRKFCNQKDLEV